MSELDCNTGQFHGCSLRWRAVPAAPAGAHLRIAEDRDSRGGDPHLVERAALCGARQGGRRGPLAGAYLVEAVRHADLARRADGRRRRPCRAWRAAAARAEICAMTRLSLALWIPLLVFLGFVGVVLFGLGRSPEVVVQSKMVGKPVDRKDVV